MLGGAIRTGAGGSGPYDVPKMCPNHEAALSVRIRRLGRAMLAKTELREASPLHAPSIEGTLPCADPYNLDSWNCEHTYSCIPGVAFEPFWKHLLDDLLPIRVLADTPETAFRYMNAEGTGRAKFVAMQRCARAILPFPYCQL